MLCNIIAHFVYIAPSVMVYHQSHQCMMNPTMRIGGMPGGSPGMGGVQSAHIYAAAPIDASQGRPSCDGPAPRGAYLQASTREPLLPPARVLPVTAMGQYSDSVCVHNIYRVLQNGCHERHLTHGSTLNFEPRLATPYNLQPTVRSRFKGEL